MHMDIARALLGHCGLKSHVASVGRVVVAHEQPGLGRQAQDFAGGCVKIAGVAAREIAAGGAHVGHEQGVADEHRIPDLEGLAAIGATVIARKPQLDLQNFGRAGFAQRGAF